MNREQTPQITRVSQAQLTPLMLECLDKGQEIVLTVTGNSMSPFLRHGRDKVVLAKPADPTALRVGDVPLYRRENGQLVLHRIVERDDGKKRRLYGEREPYPSMHSSSPLTYTMLGDAQTDLERDVRPDQILAIAEAFVRKGKRWECRSIAYQRRCLRWHSLLTIRKPLVWLWHLPYRIVAKCTRIYRQLVKGNK